LSPDETNRIAMHGIMGALVSKEAGAGMTKGLTGASAFAPFLCFFFVFLRQYAVIFFSGFFCFFIQFVFFVSLCN